MVTVKIALVYQDLIVRGGGQRLLLTQAILLQELGHEVTVFTPAYSTSVYPELVRTVNLRVVQPSKVWPSLPVLRRTLAGLEQVSRWTPFELADQDAIVGYTYPSNIAAYHAHVKWNVPVIWHCTHPPYELYPRNSHDKGSSFRAGVVRDITGIPLRIIDRRASRSFSRIAVISSKIGRRVKEIYGLSSTVLFPMVDPSEFNKNSPIVRDSDSLLYVGRLVWYKGPDLFLQVLKIVVSELPGVKGIMALAGQNTTSTTFLAFKQLIDEMGLRNNVELITDMREGAFDVSRLYSRSSVISYTCRDEDFGLVPLEASFCGKPSVLWKNCGVVQDGILENERSALVASPYDVKEFAQKVLRLLRDPGLRAELSNQAKESTLEHCHPDAYARKFEEIVKSALAI